MPTKFLTLIKNVGRCMHWNSAVRRSWITYFSWLASQVLAFHDGPSLTSSLQSKMILICSIYEFEDIQLLHPYNINISALLDFNIRQRFSKLNFFCYKAIEILMFFFLEIDISRLICLCLCSLETCQVLFAWCTRGQEVEVRQGWKGEQSSNPQVAAEICIWAICFTLRPL